MKSEKNILIAFLLNISFSFFEFFGGIFTNSVAIISDAIHDFGDALSIGLSFLLEKKSNKQPDDKYTYGYGRYSILAAIITSTILFTGSFLVIWNAIERIFNPVTVNYNGMLIFAIFGVVVNFLAAYFTRDGDSINQKAVNLHMLEDVMSWAVVLIGAIIMRFTDIKIIDPILSIIVSVYILINVTHHFKKVLDLFLEKVPADISIDEIKNHLLQISGIKDVHHIHLWSIDGINNYATMHVIVNKNAKNIKQIIRDELNEHGISHLTIELENAGETCDSEECYINHNKGHKHHHHH